MGECDNLPCLANIPAAADKHFTTFWLDKWEDKEEAIKSQGELDLYTDTGGLAVASKKLVLIPAIIYFKSYY